MTLQDKLNIIQNQFHLEVKEIEPLVYEVINSDKEINIDKLQWALEECMLITSDQIKTQKLSNGIHTKIMHVYGIILSYNKQLAWKYDSILEEKYGATLLLDYKYKEGNSISIDTIYRTEELV